MAFSLSEAPDKAGTQNFQAVTVEWSPVSPEHLAALQELSGLKYSNSRHQRCPPRPVWPDWMSAALTGISSVSLAKRPFLALPERKPRDVRLEGYES